MYQNRYSLAVLLIRMDYTRHQIRNCSNYRLNSNVLRHHHSNIAA